MISSEQVHDYFPSHIFPADAAIEFPGIPHVVPAREHRGQEQHASERHAQRVGDRQAPDVGEPDGCDEQRPSHEQREEDDAPDCEASIAEHAREQAVAELGTPKERHRELLDDRDHNRGDEPDVVRDAEKAAVAETVPGSGDRPVEAQRPAPPAAAAPRAISTAARGSAAWIRVRIGYLRAEPGSS